MDHAPPAHPHRALVIRLALIAAAAFAFGFALVPLYDVFCRVTGFNGRTAGDQFGVGGLNGVTRGDSRWLQKNPADAALPPTPPRVDRSRLVRVEFTGTVMPGLPWEVRPLTVALELHPGELHTARFLVHNRAAEAVTGHAVPSVTPGQAAQHFAKIDCFCFTRQTLLPGEAREMAVAFIVRPEIGAEISTVTLAYAFFRPPVTAEGEST